MIADKNETSGNCGPNVLSKICPSVLFVLMQIVIDSHVKAVVMLKRDLTH